MTKIGRNAPCPCGSGKKYKRCCWAREQAAPSIATVDNSSTAAPPLVIWEEDDLDELSNSVVTLLRDGRVNEAESAAADLLVRNPESVDGLERTAMVEETKGNHAVAADFYRKAARFTRTHPGYDLEMTEYYQHKAEELQGKARNSDSDPEH